jgi:hypothetical protein
MADQVQKMRVARARLEELRNHPPRNWDEIEVANYHDVVTALGEGYKADFSTFRISQDRMQPRRLSGQRAPRSGRYAPRQQYSAKLYCEDSFVQRQIGGLYLYLQGVDSHSYEEPGSHAPGASAHIGALTQRSEGAESEGYQQELAIPGPDDMELLISPAGHCYVWRIHNRSLCAVKQLRLEIRSIRSFDSSKRAFREAGASEFRWQAVNKLDPGFVTQPEIFIRFEGDHLGFGDTGGSHLLPWPNGDNSTVRRWLLNMRFVGLSKEWPVNLDLRWTVGTKTLEMMRDSVGIPTDGIESQSVTTEEVAVKREQIVKLFPGQDYPKYMRRAAMAPVNVNSAEEQTELGPQWSEVKTSDYPRHLRHWTKQEIVVKNAEQDAALGGGWADVLEAFAPYRAPRPPKTDLEDPVKWVDDWAVSDLSTRDRDRIKAQLLRADSAFWRSPDADSADLTAMRLAFDGIAKVLFEVGILTKQILQDEIPILVWDSAIAGGWYRFASETPNASFLSGSGIIGYGATKAKIGNSSLGLKRLTGSPRLSKDQGRRLNHKHRNLPGNPKVTPASKIQQAAPVRYLPRRSLSPSRNEIRTSMMPWALRTSRVLLIPRSCVTETSVESSRGISN